MTKKIILFWQQEFINLPKTLNDNYWGLGDLIRGTICSYQLSKKYNLELIVDIHNHHVSNFFDYKKTEYSEHDKNDIFFYGIGTLEKNIILFINDNTKEHLFLGTNEFCDEISEDEKNFIKNIFKPNKYFQKIIDDNILLLPKKFTIQHYRIGDSELVRNINDNNINFDIFTLFFMFKI